MPDVEVTRTVDAFPAELEGALTPEAVVVAEGSFDVREVIETEGATFVTVGRAGIELRLRFDDRESGIVYEQIEGPLETLRTTITYERTDERTRLTARSTVAAPGPGFVDRLAAWKRRGELRRALDNLVTDLG